MFKSFLYIVTPRLYIRVHQTHKICINNIKWNNLNNVSADWALQIYLYCNLDVCEGCRPYAIVSSSKLLHSSEFLNRLCCSFIIIALIAEQVREDKNDHKHPWQLEFGVTRSRSWWTLNNLSSQIDEHWTEICQPCPKIVSPEAK